MEQKRERRFAVSDIVAGKAHLAGEAGEQWLEQLDDMVTELELRWEITVGEPMNGGSRALVLPAEGKDGTQYVLKVELPDIDPEEYWQGIAALRLAAGKGYAKLYACDVERRACLLERLGKPLKQCGYPAKRQMEIICEALCQTWQIPVGEPDLTAGLGSINWFRGHISSSWEQLGYPCSKNVVDLALEYLDSREADRKPEEFVLLHGDAHNNNMLQVAPDKEEFKLIDPEGSVYEKAYDLGVLMREWPEEYQTEPQRAGRERSVFLASLTGVPEQAIWEWGYLQMVSTALLLLLVGEVALGREMLDIAEAWCEK